MDVSSLLDDDGFLRRECPHCMQQFKWHHGPANAEAAMAEDPPAYHCPLCGQPADHESWYTQEQIELIREAATRAVLQLPADDVDRALGSAGSRRDAPDHHPIPMIEPDDMVIVASPCHGYEPVKVPEGHLGPLYCLVCGSAFAI